MRADRGWRGPGPALRLSYPIRELKQSEGTNGRVYIKQKAVSTLIYINYIRALLQPNLYIGGTSLESTPQSSQLGSGEDFVGPSLWDAQQSPSLSIPDANHQLRCMLLHNFLIKHKVANSGVKFSKEKFEHKVPESWRFPLGNGNVEHATRSKNWPPFHHY